MAGAVKSEVAALAVTADDIILIVLNHTLQILDGQGLTIGNAVAHDKILFPADKGIVRAAESDIVYVVIKMELHRRELDSGIAAEFFFKIRYHHAAEAAGIVSCAQKGVVLRRIGHAAAQ